MLVSEQDNAVTATDYSFLWLLTLKLNFSHNNNLTLKEHNTRLDLHNCKHIFSFTLFAKHTCTVGDQPECYLPKSTAAKINQTYFKVGHEMTTRWRKGTFS